MAKERDLETIARFSNLAQAEVARSVLETAEIPARIRDTQIASLHWLLVPALGGVRLEVPADRAEEARRLLDEAPATEGETMAASEPGEFAPFERRKRILGTIALVIAVFFFLRSC